jgi:Leu/Phe-tRNA-protein transferase
MKAWASRLCGESEPLTMQEAALLAQIAACDRLLETRDAIQDIQCRLQRIELFLAHTVPGYDQTTKVLAQVLVERTNDRRYDA